MFVVSGISRQLVARIRTTLTSWRYNADNEQDPRIVARTSLQERSLRNARFDLSFEGLRDCAAATPCRLVRFRPLEGHSGWADRNGQFSARLQVKKKRLEQ